MILLAFRHGLRGSELCSLRWEQVDLTHGRLHVQRLKNGMPSVHPQTGTELRTLRRGDDTGGPNAAVCRGVAEQRKTLIGCLPRSLACLDAVA